MNTGIIYSCKLWSFPSLNHGYSFISLPKPRFCSLFFSKLSTYKIDADGDGGDGGDGAATILAPWPSPPPNARRDKISRKGKPLTLIRQIIDFSSIESSLCPDFLDIPRVSSLSLHFLQFSSLNLVFSTKPKSVHWSGIRCPRVCLPLWLGPTVWPA